MKTKLFIDFDGTLFDTRAMREQLFLIFEKAGFTAREAEKTYMAECMDYNYSPKRNLQRLQKIRPFNPKLSLQRIEKLYQQTPKMLYDDSKDFLTGIDRKKFIVNLLTLGDKEFQESKVMGSKLTKYFDNCYYTQIQKWNYLEQKDLVDENEHFIIIDDRGDTMEEIAKKYRKSLPIEINRSENPSDEMEPTSHFRGVKVKNLKGAEKCL